MEPKFGELITTNEVTRDAIHIATLSVTAGEVLKPGDLISFIENDNNEVVGKTTRELGAVGIVDPFLAQRVKQGQRFWMFLFPRTITSLRHNWSHPGIDNRLELIERMQFGDSKIRLRAFAEDIGVEYDELIERARYFQQTGDYWSEGGRFEGVNTYDEFWDDWKKVTGGEVNDTGGFFSCSC